MLCGGLFFCWIGATTKLIFKYLLMCSCANRNKWKLLMGKRGLTNKRISTKQLTHS